MILEQELIKEISTKRRDSQKIVQQEVQLKRSSGKVVVKEREQDADEFRLECLGGGC